MTPFLFVYGTLRSTATSRLGREQRARLQREGRSLSAAVVRGRLYDLGRYPGLVGSDDMADLVHGEIFELREPALSLTWLDAYEGVQPDLPELGEYRRETWLALLEREALPDTQRGMTAWVYVCARDLSAARRIAGGRWDG